MAEFRPGSYGYIAQKDLDTARDNAEKHPSAAGVYAQQAVETMLKQYLREVRACSDQGILHTHNLRRLAGAAKLPGLDAYLPSMWALTDAYFNTRYPGEDYSELTPEEAAGLCAAAAAVLAVLEEEIDRFRAE